MSKTKTETPVLRNSADISWEETRLYLPADETEEENKALYERLKKEIADGHPVDEYNNEVLCRLTPLQQKEVGIPAFISGRSFPASRAPLETGHLLPACRLDRSRPCICSG